MNPQEQTHPPDRPITHFTIRAYQQPDGTWLVVCPEWNYKNETNEAIDTHVGRIATEIRKHNTL